MEKITIKPNIKKTQTKGIHYLLEFWGCDDKQIDSIRFCKNIILDSAKKANLNVLKSIFHKFQPTGVTGILLLSSSHFSIHTWPEYSYVGIDLFSCGDNKKIKKGVEYLVKNIIHKKAKIKAIERGYIIDS